MNNKRVRRMPCRLPQRAAVLITMMIPAALMDGAMAQGPTLQWTQVHDFAGDSDTGLLIVPDGAGHVYVVGASPAFTGSEDIAVIKYNESGVEQWTVLYDGVVAGGYDFPVDADIDSEGNLYITGESQSSGGGVNPEWVTFKLAEADGAKLWERRFQGAGTFGSSLPRDLAMGPDGEIVVAGWSRHDDRFNDFGVVKYLADGTEAWSRQHSSPGFESDVAEAVAVGDDGSVFVAGIYNEAGDYVVGTVKYSAAGDFEWMRTYDATAVSGLEDNVQSAATDGAGNVYVVADGIDNFTDGRDFVLLKYASDGTLLWDRRVIEPTSDIEPVVLVGDDGTVYVSGSISNTSYRLIAFDPAGNQVWNRTYPGAISTYCRRDHVDIDAQGNIAALLRTVPEPGAGAFTVVRFAGDGTLLDETTLAPEGLPRTPTGFATDGRGSYFATGWWFPTEDRDVLTYRMALTSPGDLDGNGVVDVFDLLDLLSAWGACDGPTCPADLDDSGAVDVFDLLELLANWG